MDEIKQRHFEDKSLGRDRMNLLGKADGKLAKGRFDGFAKVLEQIVFVWGMGPGAVALAAGRLLVVAAKSSFLA